MTKLTELETLRARLADAEEELEAWRANDSATDEDKTREQAWLIQRALKLKVPRAAYLCAVLYNANRPVSYGALDELVPPVWGRPREANNIFNTLVSYLRRGLGADSVETLWGYGFTLTPQGRQRVKAILSETP